MTKRKELAMQTKKNLIEAAREIISQKGFQETSIVDITNQCGVAKGTFYTYFQRKEDIISEIGFTMFKGLEQEVLDEKDKTIIQKLSYYMVHFMEYVEHSGIHICRQWIIIHLDPRNAYLLEDNKTKYSYDREVLRKILRKAVEDYQLNSSAPIEELTDTINNQLYGMMICWCMSDGVYEPQDNLEHTSYNFLTHLLNEYLL